MPQQSTYVGHHHMSLLCGEEAQLHAREIGDIPRSKDVAWSMAFES